jgi:hypothetical protein
MRTQQRSSVKVLVRIHVERKKVHAKVGNTKKVLRHNNDARHVTWYSRFHDLFIYVTILSRIRGLRD